MFSPLSSAVSSPLRVVVSLDVEEEGLFSGRYAATGCSVRNVALLPGLLPLMEELGFPLTLFCAYTVLNDPECRRVLRRMASAGAEIGAHLHHWSTPPLESASGAFRGALPQQRGGEPVRTDCLPEELLRARLRTVLDTGAECMGAPLTSFRMGRWDCKNVIFPLLAEEGILADSSVCPLRAFPNGPNHFDAPADPYRVSVAPDRELLEVPVTQVALTPWLARSWSRYCGGDQRRLDTFHFWGALSPNPVWHSAAVMKGAVWLHRRRGGQVLCLFWHSSEMLPGGSPHIPDQAAADALLAKIYRFLRWLRTSFPVQGVTVHDLQREASRFPLRPAGAGDW